MIILFSANLPPSCATTMMLQVAAAVAVVVGAPAPIGQLRLSRVLSSGAVLQAEAPTLSGWADAGATVKASTTDGESATSTAGPDGLFVLRLRPRPAKVEPEGIGIKISSSTAGAPIALNDVRHPHTIYWILI